MRVYLRNYFQNIIIYDKNLVRDSFTAFAGVFIAQIVLFSFQLVIRRLYTAAEFGVFDVYFSILSVLINISCLRYDAAVILPRYNKNAKNIVVLSFINAFLLNTIVLLIFCFLRKSITNLFSIPLEYSGFFILLPLAAFFHSSYILINNWFIREKEFKLLSVYRVLRRITEGSFQSTAGAFRMKGGLIVGDLIGNFTVFTLSVVFALKHGIFREISREKISHLYRRYSDFPKFNLLPHALSGLAVALPILYISNFYGAESAGHFGFAKTILLLPTSLLGASVSKVLQQRFSSQRNAGEKIGSDVYPLFMTLLLLSIIAAIIMILAGEEIFTFTFGDEWTKSGRISEILVLPFIIVFMVSPFSVIFIALEKIRQLAAWQILNFMVVCCLYFFRGMHFEGFIWVYFVMQLTVYAINAFMIISVIRSYNNKLAV